MNHPVNTAAGGVVNKRIDTVPPGVADVNHIRILKHDRDIAIRVGRTVIPQCDLSVIVVYAVILLEHGCW